MKSHAIEVHASDALGRMTLKVSVRRDLRFRLAFALIRLAGRIGRFRVEALPT